jgi:hypothetical protein
MWYKTSLKCELKRNKTLVIEPFSACALIQPSEVSPANWLRSCILQASSHRMGNRARTWPFDWTCIAHTNLLGTITVTSWRDVTNLYLFRLTHFRREKQKRQSLEVDEVINIKDHGALAIKWHLVKLSLIHVLRLRGRSPLGCWRTLSLFKTTQCLSRRILGPLLVPSNGLFISSSAL